MFATLEYWGYKSEMYQNRYYGIAYVAVFGTLWGVLEATVGMYLHNLRVPFFGAILTPVVVLTVLSGARFIPEKKRYQLISMGLIAMFIKILSPGVLKLNMVITVPIVACFMEAGIALSGYNLAGYILSGGLACVWPSVSRIIIHGLLYGQGFKLIFVQSMKANGRILGISGEAALVILALTIMLHISAGALAGATAWFLSGRILRKKYAAD